MKQVLLLLLPIITFTCCCAKKTIQKDVTQSASKKEILIKNQNPILIDSLPKANTPIVIKPTPLTIKKAKQNKATTFSHTKWNQLLKQHVSENGVVDYQKFKTNKTTLAEYIFELSKNTPTNTWSKNQKLAYWINAYNALTVDLIIKNTPLKSIKDIKKPWNIRLWKLGEKWYNLEDIEHQILRKMDEPRIHFAIVCASYSCPKLLNKAYTANHIERQLEMATKTFINDSKRNSITSNKLSLSKIFKWFAKDFKQNGSLIDFINQYTSIPVSKNAKISYKNYNWELND